MAYRIYCDFDGTVATTDVTDVLLEAFATPAWLDIEAQWKAGKIGSANCMARQVSLMRCNRDELDEVLDGITIDLGFASFAAYCLQRDIPLCIVSDGLDYAIWRILARHHLGALPVIANRLIFLSEGRFAMVSPHASTSCRSQAGTCKCAAAAPFQQASTRILIGDGRSDFCAAASVDFVLAKDALIDHCRAEGLPHLAFSNFSEIPILLKERFADIDMATSKVATTSREIRPSLALVAS